MSRSKGFTLIELLVVIAIIGLLASIILASLNTAQQKGRDARRVSDIKEVQLALELYYDANNQYPAQSSLQTISASTLCSTLVPTYISQCPVDPSNTGTYVYQYESVSSTDSGCSSSCQGYLLVANLEAAFNTSSWTPSSGSSDPLYATCPPTDTTSPFQYCVHS